MRIYHNIEKFFSNYKTILVDGEMRPVVSYNKDAEEYINKLVKIYEDNDKPVEISLEQIEQGLEVGSGSNVASVESPLTWLSLNLIEDTNDGKTKKDPKHIYSFTEEFLLLADSNMAPGVHILNKLYQIDSLSNISKFTNLLICTLREGYLKGSIIDFPRENYKYLNKVTDIKQRSEYSKRVNEVYGYPYDTNSSPHASMRAINNLIKLELIARNGSTPEGFTKYELTEYAHKLLATIDSNIEVGDEDDNQSLPLDSTFPLLQITYGAPGTGKSHGIDEDIRKYGIHDIRTTFHPDSDYSTFVGAYKPQMEKVVVRDDRGFPVKENGQVVYEKKIVYKYTKQAFLRAYIDAWKDLENPHVLVIEEINRGNCAQIFGDLFQLLDRNDIGFSKYPISADTDIMQVLNEEFDGLQIANTEAINAHYKDDVVADVLNGSRLLLPNNLYIWATMNTSDQSLFPIDSAFKRRWEWKYVPISDAGKNWKICVNGTEYDWWSFVTQINKKIWGATKSEDKKLGYFFCKADRKQNETDVENNVISADRFVGKVLFYIYNDVFKDYGFDDVIFKDKEDNNSDLLFQCFFKADGKPLEDKVEVFLNNLEVKLASEVEDKNENDNEDPSANQEPAEGATPPVSSFKVLLDGETIDEAEQFDTYLAALKKMGMDKVEQIAAEKEYNRYDCPFVSKEQFDAVKEKPGFSYVEADGYQVIKGINKKGMSNFLKLCAEKLGHNITIE